MTKPPFRPTERSARSSAETGVRTGTAGSIGAAAVGAPTETRTAVGTDSYSLMTALASDTSVSADAIDPRASARRVLLGGARERTAKTDRTAEHGNGDEMERGDEGEDEATTDADAADTAGTPHLESATERCLERARATRVPFRQSGAHR
ncbi:hypothetical protein GS429_01360 [Natronorubrum sp. JWXQ-INN-674]|uniref:Uncharacterized protein n=1 Tax=Natronorubrum halalkaliphilum TaxID=2691917 RepID=A0A6B0VJG2_9EURY|nr:hypothetical protein [Natronorubrum halalkaliphilum]MXV60739.1 hypothetical protein [Natronorubrum halalkaliphilum]